MVKAIKGGCSSHVWYALEPFGWIVRARGAADQRAGDDGAVLKVREGSRLPFQYVMVLVKDGEKVPMWATLDDLKNGAEPERQLKKGDTVAVEKPLQLGRAEILDQRRRQGHAAEGAHGDDGRRRASGTASTLDDKTPLPFGWVTPDKANVYATPPENGKASADAQLERRTRVQHRRRAAWSARRSGSR